MQKEVEQITYTINSETNSMAKSPAARYFRTDNASQASPIFVGVLFSEHKRNLIWRTNMKISFLFDYQGRYVQQQLRR